MLIRSKEADGLMCNSSEEHNYEFLTETEGELVSYSSRLAEGKGQRSGWALIVQHGYNRIL